MMSSKKNHLTILLGLAMLGLWSCDHEGTPETGGCIEARLIDTICGEAIIQIVSPDFQDYAQAEWTDWDGNVHEAVFFTMISFEDQENLPSDGSSFYITLSEEPSNLSCIQCDATFASRPDVSLDIRIIDPCANTL